jgi:hypothetical protein
VSRERAELALNTMTAPKASRQRVAVSSNEYSSGGAAGSGPCRRRSPRASTSSRKRSPRSSKSRKASKLAHAGESRTTSPGLASAAAASTARSSVPQSGFRRPPGPRCELPGHALRGLADQVAGDAALATTGASGSKLSCLGRPPAISRTPPSKARMPAQPRPRWSPSSR